MKDKRVPIAIEKFINELPKVFDSSGETLYTGRNTVKYFTVDGTSVVVKRYKQPNIVQCFVYSFFKKSKAERAYLYADELRKRGFNTPNGIAFVEIKKCLLLRDSYFVSDYCDLPPVMPLLKKDDFDREVADSLAHFLVSLHTKGVLHGDLNLTNILYDKAAEGDSCFWLIDTNRSKFKQPSKNECVENLKRLTHNRVLMDYVVRRYAELRGWNADETVENVMRSLLKFESHRAALKKFKAFFMIGNHKK